MVGNWKTQMKKCGVGICGTQSQGTNQFFQNLKFMEKSIIYTYISKCCHSCGILGTKGRLGVG
jgi:hypothetical protein